MTDEHLPPTRTTQLVDIVFPGDTNHHGTLFGGVALAHMDKVAFIAAARHGHADFVTASCERIDFVAPAHLGELVEFTGTIVRVGRRSLGVEVTMVAETVAGERRLCSRGVFNMVAVGAGLGAALPPLPAVAAEPEDALRMVELVFPEKTSHYGSLYGGHAVGAMAKAAFVAATRRSRKPVVIASSQRVDFASQVRTGEIIELVPQVTETGRTSMSVTVDLWAESLRSGERRLCGSGTFVMVAVDDAHRPTPLS